MKASNWPFGTDLSSPNFTGIPQRVSKYDGVGGWAKDSSSPPGGWVKPIIYTAATVAVFFGVAYLGAVAGMS